VLLDFRGKAKENTCMNVVEQPEKKLGRVSFAIRLAVFIVVGFVLSVAAKVALALLTKKTVSGHWPIWLFVVVALIGGLWLLTIAIFSAVFFVKRAALPRLSDIGFYGSMRRWATVLLFLYPISMLVLLCMLFVPRNYVQRK
jgi:hypothetical protein